MKVLPSSVFSHLDRQISRLLRQPCVRLWPVAKYDENDPGQKASRLLVQIVQLIEGQRRDQVQVARQLLLLNIR